jgi:polysaccharide transporter, PST family
VISALVGLFLLFGTLRIRLVRPNWDEMVSAMTGGWPIFLSMASMIVVTSTNTMILGIVTTPEQVGFLSAAQRLIIAARALTNPVTTAIYPHMSKMAAKSRSAGLAFLEKQLIWTAAPFLVITLGMLVLGPFAARILYGDRFAETGLLLQLMSPTPFIHAVSMCFGTYYMLAFGYEKEWSKIITRMMILNFVLLALLIPVLLPVRAVALTSTLLDVFSAASAYLFYRRTVGRTVASASEPAVTSPTAS